MDYHEYQSQHRIPQVYLKQFGFEREGVWYVTVFDRTKNHTEDIRIKDYNVAVNEFDYQDEDYKIKRHYENTAGKIEDMYPKVLNSIKNQKLLTPRHEDILRHFVASLIGRAERQRDFFAEMIGDEKVRSRFLEEITLFDEQDNPADIELAFSIMNKNEHLSLIQGIITNHIVRVLRSFKALILKDFDGRGWFTSDDPVCINFQDNYSWIIPAEAEIYLPLSREYCLFLFHEKSPKDSNPLRKLSTNKIHLLDEVAHDAIMLTGRWIWNLVYICACAISID